jgi:hypothetical protein
LAAQRTEQEGDASRKKARASPGPPCRIPRAARCARIPAGQRRRRIGYALQQSLIAWKIDVADLFDATSDAPES